MDRGKAFISLQKCAKRLFGLLCKVTLISENELNDPSKRFSFICPAEETIIAGLSTRLIHFVPQWIQYWFGGWWSIWQMKLAANWSKRSKYMIGEALILIRCHGLSICMCNWEVSGLDWIGWKPIYTEEWEIMSNCGSCKIKSHIMRYKVAVTKKVAVVGYKVTSQDLVMLWDMK